VTDSQKKALFVAVPVLLAVVLVGIGFGIGRYQALRKIERRADRIDRGATMGGLLEREQFATYALAYDDPNVAEREMADYSWAVPNVPTPFVGAAPMPGVHGNAHINSRQLRHAFEIPDEKPAGTVRVFVTGGSTAYGAGAPTDAETVPGFVQQILDRGRARRTGKRYEVVNAANPAWVTTNERIWIANRLAPLGPDLVVQLSGNNDCHWGYLGHDAMNLRIYAESSWFRLLNMALEKVGHEPYEDLAAATESPTPVTDVARRLGRNVRLAATMLRTDGVPYLFALQPTLAATGKALTERERAHRDEEALGEGSGDYLRACYDAVRAELARVRAGGVDVVDLSTAFDDAGADREIFLDSYHFGDRGYRALAERLVPEVERALSAGR